MKRTILLTAALALSACSPGQNGEVVTGMSTPLGALFCNVQMSGGGSFVATLTSVALTGAAPSAAPLVVIATNAGKAAVDADCAKAALNTAGAIGAVPVSPPPNAASVPSIAIVAPASPVVPTQPSVIAPK